MASASKRQTTFAKLQREQAVREKRARKQSERLARKQRKRDAGSGLDTPGIESDDTAETEPSGTERPLAPPSTAER